MGEEVEGFNPADLQALTDETLLIHGTTDPVEAARMTFQAALPAAARTIVDAMQYAPDDKVQLSAAKLVIQFATTDKLPTELGLTPTQRLMEAVIVDGKVDTYEVQEAPMVEPQDPTTKNPWSEIPTAEEINRDYDPTGGHKMQEAQGQRMVEPEALSPDEVMAEVEAANARLGVTQQAARKMPGPNPDVFMTAAEADELLGEEKPESQIPVETETETETNAEVGSE